MFAASAYSNSLHVKETMRGKRFRDDAKKEFAKQNEARPEGLLDLGAHDIISESPGQ
jgi:hypothetical protein